MRIYALIGLSLTLAACTRAPVVNDERTPARTAGAIFSAVESNTQSRIVTLAITDRRFGHADQMATGVVVRDGLVLTTYRAVKHLDQSQFKRGFFSRLTHPETHFAALRVRAHDERCDLALVEAENLKSDSPLAIGPSVRPGERVFAWGHVMGNEVAAFVPVVSGFATGKQVDDTEYPECKQVIFATSGVAGRRGGPVFNQAGALVGLVNQSSYRRGEAGSASGADPSELARFINKN